MHNFRGHDYCKRLLYDYKRNKAAMQEIERKYIGSTRSNDGMPRGNNISDPTGRQGMALAAAEQYQTLKCEVGYIDQLLTWVDCQPQGREMRGILDMVFLRGSYYLYGAAGRLGISERKAQMLLSGIKRQLKKIAGDIQHD